MKVFKTSNSIQNQILTLHSNKSIGFVPTMGALHEGHLSIVERAKRENDLVIVSIFVNPTQFDNQEDLNTYPNQLNQDVAMLKSRHCDIVFIPSVREMYDNKIQSQIFDFEGLDTVMEGAFRNGHFDGVGTIVKKFFDIIKPDRAYFGEKDFQQLQIIKKMVADLKLPLEIIPSEIYREKDGLAMSSRNARLSKSERQAAPNIYRVLENSKKLFQESNIPDVKLNVKKEFENFDELKLEYFEIADTMTLRPAVKTYQDKKYRAFIAVHAGTIRLIDNIALN